MLDVAVSDATCAITARLTDTLNCGPVDLAPGESLTAHVTSGTTVDSRGTYDNTATTTTNDYTDEASDSTEVLCSDLTITKEVRTPLAQWLRVAPYGFDIDGH